MARGLSADLAVAAAIAIADEHGLGAVTMAAVAERCGFTTMSLYRHVEGKDDLMRRMLDSALGEPPPFDTSQWRAGLGTNAQLAWLDRGLEALRDTGLAAGDQAEIVLVLNGFVFWSVRLRQSL